MFAADAYGSGLRGIFRELQTDCWAVHTKLLAGLVDVRQMASGNITLKELLRKSDGNCRRPIVSCKALVTRFWKLNISC